MKLAEEQCIEDLANLLYNFLPGSGKTFRDRPNAVINVRPTATQVRPTDAGNRPPIDDLAQGKRKSLKPGRD